MLNRISVLLFLGLSLTSSARGAGEWFILEDQSGWHANDLAHPVAQGLKRFADRSLHSVAFTPDGDWVILFGANGVWTSNLQLPATQKLIELMKGNTLKCVAFTPGGGWCVFWNQNGYQAQGIPDAAFERIEHIAKNGGALRSISFSPTGGWVILFNEAGVYFGGVPPDLAHVLNMAVINRNPVHCVSFTSRGDWFVIAADGLRTSNPNLPVSKELARLGNEGKSLRWVTVAPELGEHHFDRWAPFIAKAYDGKIPGGYAFEVMSHGEIVASGAYGLAREPRETLLPSMKWTLRTPIGIASVSKTISAVALLKLWEESGEKFSLDAPFWPHLRDAFPSVHADVKKVTIRQLLTHRSGFKAVDDCTTPAALQKLFDLPLEHPPGEFYRYENNNFYIVRLLIEQIGHVQYTPYVKAHVLAPMGITEMETHFGDRGACGYENADARPGFPFAWNCDAWAGAAGWYGSVADLGLFLKGLRDHRVLNARTTGMMFKDQLGWDTSSPGIAKNGGWMWDEGARPGARAGQYKSAIIHFPDDVDATLLVNCDPPIDPEPLLFKAWFESQRVEPGQ